MQALKLYKIANPILNYLCFTILLCSSTNSNSAPTYGAEFEFVSDTIISETLKHEDDPFGFKSKKVVKSEESRLKRSYANLCFNGCKFNSKTSRITFNDGSYFKIDTDPGTIEITTKPMTLIELRKIESDWEQILFNHLEQNQFYVDKINGAGHFNIGAESAFFKGRHESAAIDLMVRFFIDFSNHSELATGVWMDDIENAPAISLHGARINQFLSFLANYFSQQENLTLEKFWHEFDKLSRLKSETPEIPFDFIKHTALRLPFQKEQYNLNRRVPLPDMTIEIRAMFPQKNMRDFILMAELFEARLRLLERKALAGEPIVYQPPPERLTQKEKANRFYLYVVESGLNWNDYKDFVHHQFKKYSKPSENSSRDLYSNKKYSLKTPYCRQAFN